MPRGMVKEVLPVKEGYGSLDVGFLARRKITPPGPCGKSSGEQISYSSP